MAGSSAGLLVGMIFLRNTRGPEMLRHGNTMVVTIPDGRSSTLVIAQFEEEKYAELFLKALLAREKKRK